MYFKLEHLLNDLTIGVTDKAPLSFMFTEGRRASVSLRALTNEEKEKHKASPGLLICTAVTEEEPTPDVSAVFARLANNLMPEGFKKPKTNATADEYRFIDEEGLIEEGHMPPAKLFPEQYRTFEAKLLHELTERIQRVAKIIRWRNEIDSPYKPTRITRGLSWSFDGQQWRAMPQGPLFGLISSRFYFPLSDEILRQIQGLIEADVNEPLGHELFLEAWELRTRNPRSALIIGMAAAEVGFKQCVGRLVPQAEWLANNVPSPPLKKMLSDYLPLLPAKLKFQGRVLKPPQRIRTAIGKGTEARNHTVHVGCDAPKADELKEILLSIHDLLYLLDVYCGFKWAFDNIREDVRKEMIEEFGLERTPATARKD